MEAEKPTGKAIGGKASRASLTPEQRSEAASKAAKAKAELSKLPVAKWGSSDRPLVIGDTKISCYVLEDGTRVLSQEGFLEALGRAKKAKGGSGAAATETGVDRLPSFLAANNLKPFINKDLVGSTEPVVFRTSSGNKVYGYRAELLPRVCRVYLEARDAGVTNNSQIHVVRAADILLRGLAEVGIAALVDEVTGYQKDRAKDALAKILEDFVAKELQPYMRTFPAAYYEHLFRLYGYTFPPEGNPSWRPQFFGKITNSVVYDRLAPELLPELKKIASKAEKRARLHQCLTTDIGHPKLREHLSSIVTLLKISKSPDQFKQLVDQVHPKFGDTYSIDFNE